MSLGILRSGFDQAVFFAAFSLAQRARCAAAIFLRAAVWKAHGDENKLPRSSAKSSGRRVIRVVVDANVRFFLIGGF
jgi:hypothetical protein